MQTRKKPLESTPAEQRDLAIADFFVSLSAAADEITKLLRASLYVQTEAKVTKRRKGE